MGKFREWVADKIISFNGLVTSGETPLLMEDTVYRDMLGYILGRNLDTTRGHIDFNFDEGTMDFDNTADTTNNRDALTVLYQLDHCIDRGPNSYMYPHIHYLDEDTSNKPIWKVDYKIIGRGSYAGVPWTSMNANNFVNNVNNTINGREEICSFEPISLDGLPLSANIKVRVWRDSDSAPSKVKVSFIDAHAPMKYLGSKDEFIQ